MKKIYDHIKADIRNGENLDIYVSIPVAVTIAILGLLKVASFGVLSAAILMVLSLLSASFLIIRKSAADTKEAYIGLSDQIRDLQGSIDPASVSDMFRRGYPDMSKDFEEASSILVLGTILVSTINVYLDKFEKAIRRGCDVRFITSSTESNVLDTLLFCNYKMDDKDAIASMIQYHTQKLYALNKEEGSKIEVRALPYIPPFGLVVTKNDDGTGRIYVKLFSFRTVPGQYPTIAVNSNDVGWFSFFSEQYEEFWDAAIPVYASTSQPNNGGIP